MNRISFLSLVVIGLSSTAFGYGAYGGKVTNTNTNCDTRTSFDAPKQTSSFSNCDTTPTKPPTTYCDIKTICDTKPGDGGHGGGNNCNTNAVPEPASMIALAIGGVGLLRRRKK